MNYNKRNPCPICGATDYCAYIKSQNGYLVTCHKLKQLVKKNEVVDGIDGKEYIFLYEKNGCFMFEEKNQYEAAKKAYYESFNSNASKVTITKEKTQNTPKLKSKKMYEYTKVSHDVLNEVYEKILNRCVLDEKHIRMLKKEKWSDELINKSGYFSTPDLFTKNVILKDIKQSNLPLAGVPGFFTKNGVWTYNMVSGMILPIYDIDKKIIRLQIRPDWNHWQINSFRKRGEDPPKYINFSSDGKKNGTKSGSMAGIHYNEPRFRTIIVTEGSKDAKITLEYLKRACVYLPGVDTYNAFLSSDLFNELKKRGLENVIIAYDADIIYKPQVKRAMEGFYEKLEEANVNVYYAKWTINEGKGIGDMLLNGFKPKIYKRIKK